MGPQRPQLDKDGEASAGVLENALDPAYTARIGIEQGCATLATQAVQRCSACFATFPSSAEKGQRKHRWYSMHPQAGDMVLASPSGNAQEVNRSELAAFSITYWPGNAAARSTRRALPGTAYWRLHAFQGRLRGHTRISCKCNLSDLRLARRERGSLRGGLNGRGSLRWR